MTFLGRERPSWAASRSRLEQDARDQGTNVAGPMSGDIYKSSVAQSVNVQMPSGHREFYEQVRAMEAKFEGHLRDAIAERDAYWHAYEQQSQRLEEAETDYFLLQGRVRRLTLVAAALTVIAVTLSVVAWNAARSPSQSAAGSPTRQGPQAQAAVVTSPAVQATDVLTPTATPTVVDAAQSAREYIEAVQSGDPERIKARLSPSFLGEEAGTTVANVTKFWSSFQSVDLFAEPRVVSIVQDDGSWVAVPVHFVYDDGKPDRREWIYWLFDRNGRVAANGGSGGKCATAEPACEPIGTPRRR